VRALQVRALVQAAAASLEQDAEPEAVLALLRRAQALCREAGLSVGLYSLLSAQVQGEAYFRAGDRARAEQAWLEGLRFAEELRWSPGTLPFSIVRLCLLTARKQAVRPLVEHVVRTGADTGGSHGRRGD
jgi:hypothetical protein